MAYSKKRVYRRRRNYRRRYKKTYRKKYNKYRRPTTIKNRAQNGVPDRMFVTLSYCDHAVMPNTDSNGISFISYSGNSINQPGTGQDKHFPAAYKQWSAFYNYARVRASKATVMVNATYNGVDANSNATQQYYVWLKPIIGTSFEQTDTMVDQVVDPYMNIKYLGTADSGRAYVKLKSYMTTKKLYGLKGIGETPGFSINIDDDLNLNTVPTYPWSWYIFASNTSQTANLPVHNQVITKIVYYVELYGRRDIDMDEGP